MSILQASLHKRFRPIAAGLMVAILPYVTEASTYGSGTYNQSAYSPTATTAPLVTVGPISLPNTGSTWVALGVALTLAVLAGVKVWRSRHPKPAN